MKKSKLLLGLLALAICVVGFSICAFAANRYVYYNGAYQPFSSTTYYGADIIEVYSLSSSSGTYTVVDTAYWNGRYYSYYDNRNSYRNRCGDWYPWDGYYGWGYGSYYYPDYYDWYYSYSSRYYGSGDWTWNGYNWEYTPKAATPAVTATYKTVTAKYLNFRTGPGTGYSIIGAIPYGSVVQYVSSTGAWSYIYVDNQYGYVSSKYLK